MLTVSLSILIVVTPLCKKNSWTNVCILGPKVLSGGYVIELADTLLIFSYLNIRRAPFVQNNQEYNLILSLLESFAISITDKYIAIISIVFCSRFQ
jgi:hypothetical protein